MPGRLGWRIGARIVDLVLLGWIAGFLVIEVQGRLLSGDFAAREIRPLDLSSARFVAVVLAVSFLYEVVPVALRGVSFGKATLGLRVVDGDTLTPPRATASVLRWGLLYVIPVLVPVIGLLVLAVVIGPALIPGFGRGLHDLAAGTVVIDAR